MQTKSKDLALDPKALRRLLPSPSPSRKHRVKIRSRLQQLGLRSPSSKTRVLLGSLGSCLTLFPRLRIRSTGARHIKGPRRRKEVLAGHRKVRRAPEDDDPDLDHPDGSQNADRGPQNDNANPSLEIAPKRDLTNGEREVDRGLRLAPDLILSGEASAQDPGGPDRGPS